VSAGRNAVRIRIARPYDAAALLDLKRQLDEDTAFMMYEPGERDSSVQDLARELAGVARSPNSVILLAEVADQLAGYLELTGGSFRRSRATAYVVITRAIRLYERMGFSVEGRRSECLLIDGRFIDELTMAVILPTPS